MNSVSLYAHIPFCAQKCFYCDFFSVPEKCGIPEEYVDSLLSEASYYADWLHIDSWRTLYVGGGTPSLLSTEQLMRLVRGLGEVRPFALGSEITVEMNPESVSSDLLGACEASGVNRISLGIQALDDKPLSAVHRICSAAKCMEVLSLFEKNWRGRLSVDFIAGLPGQTYSSFKNQFDKIFSYKKIDHISLYTLTIEENTPLGKLVSDGKIAFSQDKADNMWILGRNILEKNGFFQYEVSNFARPGFESRHNKTYWHLEDYVGIGAGASGTIYEKSLRWNNLRGIKSYCEFWKNGMAGDISSVRETENLSAETIEFEFLMMGFRLLEGISEQTFFRRFGKNLLELENSDGTKIGLIFDKWRKNRLLRVQGNSPERTFSLNKRGILFLNRFLEELI